MTGQGPCASHRRLPRSFWCLNIAQFLGALNDNLFKLLTLFALTRIFGPERISRVTSIVGIVFALPFLLFLPAAGVLADRISKQRLVIAAKILEVLVMLAGLAAFLTMNGPALYATLFLMTTQSALFAPAKYGILPELVDRTLLSLANSRIVMWTNLAILLGTFGTPTLVTLFGDRLTPVSAITVLVAIVGALVALGIEHVPPAGSPRRASWWFWTDIFRSYRAIRHDRYLTLAIAGVAYYSMAGAFLLQNLLPFGMRHLGLTEVQSGYLFATGAIGVGAGAWLAGRLSGRNVEFGVVPLGSAILACASVLVGCTRSWSVAAFGAWLAGVGAGLFAVPLEAFIQLRAPHHRRGEVMALNNFLSWSGILAGSAMVQAFDRAGLTPARGFGAIGALTLLLTGLGLVILPDFVVRFVGVVLTRSLYRVRALGLDYLPTEGGALLVANHVSYLDALHILAVQQRRVRFLMYRPIYERHPLRPIFRLMGCIPIAPEDPPRQLLRSLQAARKALDDGFLVCVFAEGALTRTGFMSGFKPGFERIVRGSSHPIIPLYLGGTWGSLFSHYRPRWHARVPRRFPREVTVVVGRPLPSTATAYEVYQAVQQLSCDYFESLKPRRRPLGYSWVRAARRNRFQLMMTDTITGRRLTGGQALIGSILLARRLGPLLPSEGAVGILLPPSIAGALVNLALALRRRTTVNLNFTVSAEAFRSALHQAQIQTVITSRRFLEQIRLPAELPSVLYVEDLLADTRRWHKLLAWLTASVIPARWCVPTRGFHADEPVTIVFSSGTTGEPKGVVLSHHNILSNVEGLMLCFRARSDESLAACLPLFHSFGYTCGVWFPLLAGIRTHYHPSPLDSARIAQMIREEQCTAFFTTPTFLLGLIRRAQPDDLRSLRWIITGAEKLKDSIADAFESRFGIRPLEGYGTTELSPVVSLSIPHVDIANVREIGWKPGSVGRPIPGVAVRIVDPDTGQPLGADQPGMLTVRGPNVMVGYLNRPDLTAEVIRDGWYHTGDVARVDADGFLYIVDRLARFSKIAGEMVPHYAIEEVLLRGLGATTLVVAVTSTPDERRGERLIVLYTEAAGSPERLRSIIEKSSLPNLWRPDREAYVRVEEIPVTSTGKLDVRRLRQMAKEFSTPRR